MDSTRTCISHPQPELDVAAVASSSTGPMVTNTGASDGHDFASDSLQALTSDNHVEHDPGTLVAGSEYDSLCDHERVTDIQGSHGKVISMTGMLV